jgi:hypothetical protein
MSGCYISTLVWCWFVSASLTTGDPDVIDDRILLSEFWRCVFSKAMLQNSEMLTEPAQTPVSASNVHGVGIRVPPFWPEKSAVWFAQLEDQLALSGVKPGATELCYVVTQLENKYAAWGVNVS